jgi:uncharacterized protein involved in type VI secretion and phage assembly
MTAMFDLLSAIDAAQERKRLYGAYAALVVDIKDPDGIGRVRIQLPWSPDPGDGNYQVWARIAQPMAGNNRGTWLIPDTNDEVLVMFEGGDPRLPYVIGMLWNGTDKPPESMDGAGRNFRKVIRSRNGNKLTLDDTDGQETITLETPAGQKITLTDGPASVEIQDSNGNDVKLDASGITVRASGKVTVQAGGIVEVNTSMLTVNAGLSKFSGVVNADAVITNSVVSASYSPGAGNIW